MTKLPTPDECSNCVAIGKCVRHPSVPKVGRLLAICSGMDPETSDSDRESYMRLWDVLSGTQGATFTDAPEPAPPPQSPDPESVFPEIENKRPLECRHRGDYIRLCGG